MNSLNYFTNHDIYILVYASTLLVGTLLILLYLFQRKNKADAESRIDALWDSTNKLVDHPLLIIDESLKVIYINEKMLPFIPGEKGKSLKNEAIKPLVYWEGKPETLNSLIATYTKRAIKNNFLFKNATIQTKERKYAINIKITEITYSKEISYIGIALFDISDKLEVLKRHYTNPFTKLPNHNRALADLTQYANHAVTNHSKFSAAILICDKFTEMIASIGYTESLEIIIEISKSLKKLSEKHSFKLYHIEGDHFLLFLPDIKNSQESLLRIEEYKIYVENHINNKNENYHISISSGISTYPDNTLETLIKDAYKGILLSLKKGIGYNSTIAASTKKDKEDNITFTDIKLAFEKDQFILYYQPIFDLTTESIVAAEALIRWLHPTRGILPPDLFLPLIENHSFMTEFSEFVINKSVEQLSIWKNNHFKSIQVSINLSAREFESANFSDFIDKALQKYHIDSKQLKVEITENIAMQNEEYTLSQFSHLKKRGIQISLDDFGTGYSSFSMLEMAHIDTLKIDKSFIIDIRENSDHFNIVKAMITMAHALNTKVIAEGVENQRAVEILKELNCDYLQGYHIGKPVAVFEFQQLIRNSEMLERNKNTILIDTL